MPWHAGAAERKKAAQPQPAQHGPACAYGNDGLQDREKLHGLASRRFEGAKRPSRLGICQEAVGLGRLLTLDPSKGTQRDSMLRCTYDAYSFTLTWNDAQWQQSLIMFGLIGAELMLAGRAMYSCIQQLSAKVPRKSAC